MQEQIDDLTKFLGREAKKSKVFRKRVAAVLEGRPTAQSDDRPVTHSDNGRSIPVSHYHKRFIANGTDADMRKLHRSIDKFIDDFFSD